MMSDYSILIQFFIVTPICHLLLTNPRITQGSKHRGLIYAILFLLGVALLTTYLSLMDRPPSYYGILGVSVTATTADIKKAYKAAALHSHPDKNPSIEAEQEFTLINIAYETLSSPDTRRQYDRFGTSATSAASPTTPINTNTNTITLDQIIYYLVWFVLTYVLCLSRDTNSGRMVSWILLFLTGIAEYQLLFGGWNPLTTILPYTAIYEKIYFLHALYPSLMHACRLLSQFLYVDYDLITRKLMNDILISNSLILNSVAQIQIALERSTKKTIIATGGTTPTSTLASGASPASTLASSTSGSGLGVIGGVDVGEVIDDLSGTSALPLSVRLRQQQHRLNQQQQQIAQTQNKGGIPSWAIPVGLFILFNWFGRSSNEKH